MTNYSEKLKKFNELYANAIKDVNDGWCYVQDVSINNYTAPDADMSIAEGVLEQYVGAAEAWKGIFVEGQSMHLALFELHILPSIAVAIAIKVFACPEAEIMFGCATSKYNDGEVDYWWAISSIAPNGIALSSEVQYKDYKYHLKMGEMYTKESNNGFIVLDGVLEEYNGSDTSIVIPSTVKMIDNHTFYGCRNLVSIEIPNGVTKIGSKAFADCSSLRSVTLPDTVTEIQSEAFYGCYNLNTITVPQNLVKLGKNVFAGNYGGHCRSLSKVIPSENSKTFKNSSLELVWNQICQEIKPFNEVIAQILTFWLSAYNDLIKDEDSVIKKIKTLKSEILDYCIQTDDDIALNNLLAIIKLKIDEIDNYVEIANSKGSVKISAFLLEYKSSNFSKKQISNYDNKVTKTALDKSGLSMADWKKIFDFEKADDGLIITRYKGKETIVEIPMFMGKNRVVAITNYIFKYNSSPKELVLPDDEVIYSSEAFSKYQVSVLETSDCKDKKIDDWKIKTLKDGTIKLVYYCRYDAENVQIPESIDSKRVAILGSRLFSGHREISFVDVPYNVTEIEPECFSDCYGLVKVNLPDGLKTIGSMAFRFCNINVLDIPASVEKICGGALDGAENVIIRGNPALVKNLTIFRNKSNVYAESYTEVYRYCKNSLGGSSWFSVNVFPLSDVPENF